MCGTISTSSVPANVVVRSVQTRARRVAGRGSGPVRMQPAARGRHAVGGAGRLAGPQLGKLHRCAAVVADRFPQLQVRRRLPAEVGELDVDARRLADRHHRRTDDPPDVERWKTPLHRDHRNQQRDDDADAEHVELDQSEDAPDHETGDGRNDCGPAVPGDHSATDGYGHRGQDFADDRVAGDTPRHRVGPQHHAVRQHRFGNRFDIVGRRVFAALDWRPEHAWRVTTATWHAATGRAAAPGDGGWPRRDRPCSPAASARGARCAPRR